MRAVLTLASVWQLPYTPAELVLLSVVAGLFGVGTAALNAALPTGQLPFKPFACRTCMSGWGSIVASSTLAVQGDVGLGVLVTWFILSVAGTGVAHLVLGLADKGPPVVPPFLDDVPPGPPNDLG